MVGGYYFECLSWASTTLYVSLFVISAYMFKQLLNIQSMKTPALPGTKDARLIFFFRILYEMQKRRRYRSSFLLCLMLQFACGLCVLFDKKRIFRIDIFLRPFIFFYKPETVEVVLSSAVTIDKANEYGYLDLWLGTGLLTSSGQKWRTRRKMLTPSFHFKILEDFIPIFNDQSNVLVTKLRECQPDSSIDIRPLITLCTLDIICETAMGVSMDVQKGGFEEYVQAIHEIANIFLFRTLRPWLYSDLIFNWSSSGKSFNKNIKIIHGFTRKIIKEKKLVMIKEGQIVESNGISINASPMNTRKPRAFLELLLKQHLKDSTFTEEDIREEVDTFVFEGHDTTAMALCWTLYLIGQDDKVQKKMHEELDDIFGGDGDREITREDLTRMKYLECVIKETLRLYPSVPFIGREVKEPIKVLDYTIDPGSVCFIFPLMLHRDPESFPNPEKFDPERFFPENTVGRHPYSYVPFSAGPRNCIGQKFALMEEKIVLSNILRNFRVLSKEPRDKVNTTPNLVIRNLDPLQMYFIPRYKNYLSR